MLTCEIEVIKCRKQNMAVLFNVIAITLCKCNEKMGKRLVISSDFGYISNILTLASIICVHNEVAVVKSHRGI